MRSQSSCQPGIETLLPSCSCVCGKASAPLQLLTRGHHGLSYHGAIWLGRLCPSLWVSDLRERAEVSDNVQDERWDLFFSFIFISWRLITLQYCNGFCHTLTWISHGFTCVPHPDPPSHLPPYPIPLGLPSAPGPSTCLMHPTWAGDLFHPT